MQLEVTFLGTGTSQGVPVIACDCAVCHSPQPTDKRLRASIHVQVGDVSLVVDTGPDFRQQMLTNRILDLHGILYTHCHKDHVAGMDDVRAYNYKYKKAVHLWGDELTLQRLHEEFPYVFADHKYPGVPEVETHLLDGSPFEVEGVHITPIPVLHYRMPVLGFRIGNFAYITDANYIPPESMALLQGLEVLVLNALRHEPHISHFTLAEAVAVAQELKPRYTYFTHISHLLGLHSEVNATLPEGMYLAYDGLRIRV